MESEEWRCKGRSNSEWESFDAWGRAEERKELVLSLSHPPSSFSAPVMVTSSSQVSGMMKNEECGMDEFLKMADNCSDKDKDKDIS